MQVTTWPETRAGDDWKRRDRIRVCELRRGWGEFLGCIRWRVFVTLTFDARRAGRGKAATGIGQQMASREAFWWCGQTGRILRRPIGWVYATERGRSGQWHAHAVLAGVDAGELEAATMIWRQRNGRIDCRAVSNAHGVALYTTKEAALRGEIVWSDTLSLYRGDLQAVPTIALHAS